ncbi:hypothetical protein GALL_184760 [mine drainage metagenome]|uniref:Uncharacterized protein n=1 Tax=mine drainage metagenome TaxID=410659 RepID=A0A1J5SCU8_9ZZZZ
MTHDVNQLDIPDRELLAGNARPNVWTEIGEAEITHTIFGRAKVHIIRKHDNTRRVMWLAGITAIVIAAAVVWLGLLAPQQKELAQSEDLPQPVRAKAKVSPPAFQSENIASPAIPPAAIKEPATQAQVVIDKPATITMSASQPTKASPGNEPQTGKPPVSQPKPHMVQRTPIVVQPKLPLAVGKPSSMPAINAASSPVEAQPPARLLPPKPIAAPVTATSSVVPAQPASSPADIIQLTAPLGRHGAATPPPAAIDQSSAPVDAQSK